MTRREILDAMRRMPQPRAPQELRGRALAAAHAALAPPATNVERLWASRPARAAWCLTALLLACGELASSGSRALGHHAGRSAESQLACLDADDGSCTLARRFDDDRRRGAFLAEVP
ncbi:MAG: hypothetical protein U0166_06210 [Acidobacteriota bacterium]